MPGHRAASPDDAGSRVQVDAGCPGTRAVVGRGARHPAPSGTPGAPLARRALESDGSLVSPRVGSPAHAGMPTPPVQVDAGCPGTAPRAPTMPGRPSRSTPDARAPSGTRCRRAARPGRRRMPGDPRGGRTRREASRPERDAGGSPGPAGARKRRFPRGSEGRESSPRRDAHAPGPGRRGMPGHRAASPDDAGPRVQVDAGCPGTRGDGARRPAPRARERGHRGRSDTDPRWSACTRTSAAAPSGAARTTAPSRTDDTGTS
jgi:hypothetical protein